MNASLGSAAVEVLPLALVIALSPISIIPAVLVLQGDRPRESGLAFLAGWVLGIAALTTLFTALPGLLEADSGPPPTWASWVRIVVGAALIVFGICRWFTRASRPHQLPGLRQLTEARPAKLFGLSALLTVVNVKVLFMCVAAGLVIANSGLGALTPVAVAGFVVVATSSVVLPVLGYSASAGRLDPALLRLNGWLQRHSGALVAVTLIVIGVLVLHRGIVGL